MQCRYRNDEGLSCSIGVLLPDEVCPALEGTTLKTYKCGRLAAVLNKLGYISARMLGLLKSLQDIHDSESPADWDHCLYWLAASYDLTYKPLAEPVLQQISQQTWRDRPPML